MWHVLSFLIVFSFFELPVFGWDLTNYNISSNYYVSSVTVYGNRAFLALPRSSCYNDIVNPTMVEASWYNEQQIFLRKSPFFLESQTWNICDHLQDAISLDMEPIRPRLWVLDKGNSNCPPKIVIYNLFQKINYTLEVPESASEKLNCLLIDSDSKLNGARGYIGLNGAPYLLVFSLNEFKWWKINLESENTFPISTKFLALARKESILYITGGEERGIFSLDLASIRREFTEDTETANVTYLGEKLGASSGLISDFKDGLSYYIPQFYVIVRWDTRYPSQAEHYNVLAQSYPLLPFVSQLVTGPQNGIWALANPGPPNQCPDNPPLLKNRLVKILKYNMFI